jgi:hypothetical protein
MAAGGARSPDRFDRFNRSHRRFDETPSTTRANAALKENQ